MKQILQPQSPRPKRKKRKAVVLSQNERDSDEALQAKTTDDIQSEEPSPEKSAHTSDVDFISGAEHSDEDEDYFPGIDSDKANSGESTM